MSGLLGSPARLRLYTTVGLYSDSLASLVTGKTHQGDDVATLEASLQRMLGVKHAIATPLARVGLYLAMKHTIKPGQKVILSPYTIADVVNMVLCAGGVPVFADIDRDSCNISAASVESLIDDQTGAVLVTHFYGQMADMDALVPICAARNIPVLEDAAQAFGARHHGKPAGTLGRGGVFSFGMYKNINSFYGGAIVTNDDAMAASVRAELATWPLQSVGGLASKVISAFITDVVTSPLVFRTVMFRFFRWAFVNNVDVINNKLKIDVDPKAVHVLPETYRCRITPLQARLVMKQLDLLEPHADARLRSARLYHDGLKDIPELMIAPLREDRSHIYWYFPIQHADRKALVAGVMQRGRDITMSYHRNCAAVPCFSDHARDCPNAQATADSLIYLPTYPRYGEDEVRATIAAIRDYFGR
jgi:perosamine synthetase